MAAKKETKVRQNKTKQNNNMLHWLNLKYKAT